MSPTDVIEKAVVGLSYDGIHTTHPLVVFLVQRPGNGRLHTLRDRERIGKNDRRFDFSEFDDLGGSGELAVSISPERNPPEHDPDTDCRRVQEWLWHLC